MVFRFACAASLALLPTILASPALSRPSYWFSFGDSYTQTGFNITTGPLPSSGNPMGNPAYPGDTATPGENWIDVATTKYNHSLVLTYNFGYSGATVSRDIVPPFADFHPQPWESSNALFSIWIGINDIDLSYALDVDHTALTNQLITRYFHYVVYLQYDLGGRNFLFLNVPPLDRTPGLLVQNTTVRASESRIIAYYNAQLAAGVDKFKGSHSGVRTWQYDAHAAFTRVLDHPEQYGFNDIAGDDGTTPGQFWYNWLHPVSAAQVIFGKEVGQLLDDTPW
ncbi:fungal cellulose binding domain-containing protein [Mycena olivaceomarginata]|nr:fungal cellulose binding domain-containing protein [Mycena olivaceomarginata]